MSFQVINLDGQQVMQMPQFCEFPAQQNEPKSIQIKVAPGMKQVQVQFLKCSACSCEFSDPLHRVAHINVCHPKILQKEGWTPCSKCLMRFPRKDVLKEHISRVHHDGKNICSICNDVFWTDSIYRQHWKKCIAQWVKSSKNVRENSELEEQLIKQIWLEEGQSIVQSKSEGRVRLSPKPDSNPASTKQYLCAFCQLMFLTKEGYMEHAKLGQCSQQPSQTGKYKNANPVRCSYCPAHCASRRALRTHVKEAHTVVTPTALGDKSQDINNVNEGNASMDDIKHHIFSCRPCDKIFNSPVDLTHHQQTEHFECENCFKFFTEDGLVEHRGDGSFVCFAKCMVCADSDDTKFYEGESYVDHMNSNHRSLVGMKWLQCAPCLKLNKRYYNRYYPTKKSLQLHLSSVHMQNSPTSGREPEVDRLIQAFVEPSPPTVDLQGQQLELQLPSDQQQLVEQIIQPGQSQQIQIIQTETGGPDAPQVITLYTWAGQ